MSTPKQLVKNALQATAAALGHHRWSSQQPRLWILMYHRILPKSDPRFAVEEPGMVVTPESFTSQLSILREFLEIMPLSEWHQRAKNNQPLPPKACAITFDDGWLDNYQYALPILKDTGTPATVFTVAKMIGTDRQFWPNRIADLCSNHLEDLRSLDGADWLTRHLGDENTLVNRELIASAIDASKAMNDDEIEIRLDHIENTLALAPGGQPALMDWQQVNEMVDSSLIEIGSHTCTHRRLLPTLPADKLEEEIVASKLIIESKLERPVRHFCYPNGDCSPQALELVKQTYDLAVTTQRGINNRASDIHQLNRIGIHEDASDNRTRFLARISGLL